VKKIVIGVLAVFGLAVAAVFFFRSSEEEKIDKMLHDCAEAAEKGNAEGILRHLDPSCTLNGSNYQALGDRLRRDLERIRGASIEIGVVPQVVQDDAEATVHVRVRAAQHLLGEEDVAVKLKRVNGEWKIVRVDEVR
jgi:hypothetical protein